jgi:serine/threonine protein kinase
LEEGTLAKSLRVTSAAPKLNNWWQLNAEIIFQFKVSHANVVKLIGCCLETDVPTLVFEFVSNGSLEDRLHGGDKRYTLSLLKRLDIAIGSAEALSHIHSHGDHVHGDVKPANILLDDDLIPKVSDFGSSKLLSVDRYARAVAADRSYVDPVYEKTDHFTVKSDVYSFGVVLLELITRKTAKYDGNRYLPLDFVKCFKDEGSGRKMYDVEVFSGDDAQSQRNMECLDRISMLAVRCLKEDVEERPTMVEVVEDLKQVREMACGGSSSAEAS